MTIAELPHDHQDRLHRAHLALDGLSVGDALGGQFFIPSNNKESLIAERAMPRPPWRYTDDTEMALAILEVLQRHGRIDQDDLSRVFARRFHGDMYRGYGSGTVRILSAIHEGQTWSDASSAAFDGMGSMGNGAAMRVAPVGAYFADNIGRAIAEADLSAFVTHAHPEGRAGAIAVAVAAAFAWQSRDSARRPERGQLLRIAWEHTADGPTRSGIAQALQLAETISVEEAAYLLGNGSRVISSDTVPFALWVADRHLDDFEEAIWTTIAGFGDIDTNCAIVGGVVALHVGRESIPDQWLQDREPLDFVGGCNPINY
jgi:ADP-ribosylglycohydrolase